MLERTEALLAELTALKHSAFGEGGPFPDAVLAGG